MRRQLVARQRELVAAADAVVVEGRDIGTVVLPECDAEVYLTARRRSGPSAGPASSTSPTPTDRRARRRTSAAATSTTAAGPTARCARRRTPIVVDSTDLDRRGVIERILELAGAVAAVDRA